MKSNQENGVVAVVVTFHPETRQLLPLLSSLADQVDTVIVVDNTPYGSVGAIEVVERSGISNVNLVSIGSNLGVAKALNIGIEEGLRLKATYFVFSDQDSLPQSGMISGLLRAYDELSSQQLKVGAIGPTFVNSVVHGSYRFQVRSPSGFGYRTVSPSECHPHVDTLSLITSGILIPASVLRDVGNMCEDLFIDHVDVEWCHRVRSRGYRVFGTAYASMVHQMGDTPLAVWVFGWRLISGYGPTRLYYRFRNFIYILGLDYVPTWWKWRATWFWLGEAYAHLIFSNYRIKSLSSICRGCVDGFKGLMGERQGD